MIWRPWQTASERFNPYTKDDVMDMSGHNQKDPIIVSAVHLSRLMLENHPPGYGYSYNYEDYYSSSASCSSTESLNSSLEAQKREYTRLCARSKKLVKNVYEGLVKEGCPAPVQMTSKLTKTPYSSVKVILKTPDELLISKKKNRANGARVCVKKETTVGS